VQSLRSLFVEGEGRGTPHPNSQGSDQCIFECSGSISESNDSMVDLLLVLHAQRIGRQDHLNVDRDFLPRTLVKALLLLKRSGYISARSCTVMVRNSLE